VIDVTAQKLVGSVRVGKRPRGIGFTPDGARAYVACELANTVYAVDVANRKVLATIRPAAAPTASRCIRRAARSMSPTCDGTVMVIDTATDKVTSTIKVGNRPWTWR